LRPNRFVSHLGTQDRNQNRENQVLAAHAT